MSRTTRRQGCNKCIHAVHQHDENYLCVEKEMWVWPWGVDAEEELPKCEFYSEFKEKGDDE